MVMQHVEVQVNDQQQQAHGALDQRRLSRVLGFIDNHLCEELSVDALAAAAFLSKYHFSRAFRVATGTSPKRYLRSKRLEMAKSLLLEDTHALSSIAALCCFSCAANFSRAFRSATGTTPTEYRRTFTSAGVRMRQYLSERLLAPAPAVRATRCG
jgi:AraC family transcriptional regulator